jgi:DNA processing protein
MIDFNTNINKNRSVFENIVHPIKEMAAYEALWTKDKISFKKLSSLFSSNPNLLPSKLVDKEEIERYRQFMEKYVLSDQTIKTRIVVNGTFDYPKRLRDATEPIEVFYYSGNLDYLNYRSVAIVGTRNPSEEGLRRTDQLVRQLLQDDFIIVSGLAKGIDSQAHKSTLERGGKTIAVIGTPLNEFYPKENAHVQKLIAKDHLLISQIPFYRYSKQGIYGNRLFFPERNKTMSALTEATIIIEAGETSGTLIQARAALKQGRKLFILQSCFENPNITWPSRFEKKGAIRVRTYDDIISNLKLSEDEANEN